MLDLPVTAIKLPELIAASKDLPTSGKLMKSAAGLVYVKIDDRFIHDLYPLLPIPNIEKPNYFSEENEFIGAHISCIYPEEDLALHPSSLGQTYHFDIGGLFTASLEGKAYYALKIISPSLIPFRQQYGLSELLKIKNYRVPFHITIGVVEIMPISS